VLGWNVLALSTQVLRTAVFLMHLLCVPTVGLRIAITLQLLLMVFYAMYFIRGLSPALGAMMSMLGQVRQWAARSVCRPEAWPAALPEGGWSEPAAFQ
jgi:hypothetical protein